MTMESFVRATGAAHSVTGTSSTESRTPGMVS